MSIEATAHDVFEINACHGNKFENSCQTACQFQYILVGLLYYSTWDVHWKKNNLAMFFWLVVGTWWQLKTLRAYWLLCGTKYPFFLFFKFPWWLMSSLEALFSLCFLSFPCDSAGTLSNMSIINQVERTNSTICSRRCTQSWDQYNTAILISFRNFVWVISTKILVYTHENTLAAKIPTLPPHITRTDWK